MVVAEFVALLGAKIDQGSFQDVFSLLDHVQSVALKAARLIDDGIRKGLGAIHDTAMLGDEVAATSEKLGIAADALQELQYAATLSDASAEGLAQGLKFLGKNAAEAAANGGEAAKAFQGIKLKDGGKIRDLDDLLADLADKLVSLPDQASRIKLATDVLGRGGAELLPMLMRGSAGIDTLREEAQRLGVVMNGKTLEAASAYDDALKRLQYSVIGLRTEFASPLIEKVSTIFDKMRAALTSKGGIRAVDALSKGFERLLAVVDKVVDVFSWFLESETRVTVAMFALQAIVIALIAGATTLSYAFISAAASAIGAWLAAAAPFLALGALVVLIADELFTFIEGGDSLLGRLIKTLDSVDPDSSPLVKLLKTAGSLLFDLTNTAKWEKFGQAIADYAIQPLRDLTELIFKAMDAVGIDTSKFNFSVKSDLSEIAPGLLNPMQAFPGLADPLSLGGQSIGDSLAAKFPGAAEWGSKLSGWNQDAGDFVSTQFNGVGAGNVPITGSTTIQAPITIDARGATDPQAVGEAVRKVVREELGNELSNAQGAIGS